MSPTQDEASIRGRRGALDEAALLQASDDAGRVRKRHAELVGEAGSSAARRASRAVRCTWKPDHRQAVRLASRRPRAAVVGEQRRERVDDLGRAVAGCHLVDCHLDHYGYRNHSVKRNGCLCLSHSAAAHPDVDGLWIAAATGAKLGDKWYCVSSRRAAILRASRRGKRYRIRRLHQGFRYRQRWLRSPRSDACSFGTLRVPAVSRAATEPDRRYRRRFSEGQDGADTDRRDERDGARVHDLKVADDAEAFLVEPTEGGRGPAILFLHWFDTQAPDGNRTQFVEEAVGLAREHGVRLAPAAGTLPLGRRSN